MSLTRYGDDYELPIGWSRAKALLKGHDIPRPGWETLVAKKEGCCRAPFHWMKWQQVLYLQNVAGMLVLASYTTRRDKWGEVFGPEFTTERAPRARPQNEAVTNTGA